jgi:asparagine synthase (glutamine-hydrolysing)
MCGINGAYAYSAGAPALDREELLRVRDSMSARGPDGAGLWLSPDNRTGLTHRRLAIIDLSEAGAQPMPCADGRYVVSFNGEIYNYPELRAELVQTGVVFRSHSDTEVLLHLYARYGGAVVEKLRGMFAFALWDNQEKTLFLARDPHGIKPLYYADDGKTLRFASQVRALKESALQLTPDPAGAVGFLLWGSVPEPLTLYREIRLLPAGSTLTISAGRVHAPLRYWDLADVIRASRNIAAQVPPGEEQAWVREALRDSIRHHLLADVPVGAFLSAGLDSSTVVGLSREVLKQPLHTLTLSFDGFVGTANDECPEAAEIARFLGVKHQCIRLPAGEQEAELEKFLAVMDQPTVDGINTWFVSLAAREAGLKVVLSGLGGDELLGGYASFTQVPQLQHRARSIPSSLGPWLRRAALMLGRSRVEASVFELAHMPQGAYHLAKGVFMPWELSHVMEREAARSGLSLLAEHDAATAPPPDFNAFEQVAYLEGVRYMRNQLLRDTDWVSMAHSLEVRVPMVDSELTSRVIGLAASGRLPTSKLVLHQALSRALPQDILNRPKTGFITPTWRWLRHHPGLDAWRRVELLRNPKIRDPQRWAYTHLSRANLNGVLL